MSNLLSHLWANQAIIHTQIKEKGHQTGTALSLAYQPTLSESVEKSQEYDKKGKRWMELTEAVTYYIVKDGLPVYTVEKPGFKKLLKAFDKRYTLITKLEILLSNVTPKVVCIIKGESQTGPFSC